MSAIHKSRKKAISKPYDAKKAEVVKWSAREFEITEGYARQIWANPNQTTGRSDEIRKAMNAKYAELKKLLS